MFEYIKRVFSKEIFKLFLMVLFVVSICFGIGITFLNNNASSNAQKWLEGDIKHLSSSKKLIFSSSFDNENKELKDRLQDQFNLIRDRAKTHQEVMVFYYSKYYMAITMATITGIIASLMLIIISKKGWENTNKYIITIFLTLSGFTAYFASFPTLFEQEKNIDANKKLYTVYLNLENRILSYCVTQEDIDEKKVKLNKFIHLIDNSLSKNNKLPIELNHDGIQTTVDSINTITE